MEEVKDLLEDVLLPKYTDTFHETGYDSFPHLFVMGPS